jgi:hypothetical protein
MTRFVSRLLATVTVVLLTAPALSAQMQIPVANGAMLEFTGRLHSQFEASSVDGAGSNFFTRRARITVELTVNELFSAKIQPEYSGGGTTLKDAFVEFTVSPSFGLSFGQLKRAFDLVDLDSSTDLSTIERDGGIEGLNVCAGVGGICSYSRFTSKLAYGDRDVGVRVDVGGGPLRFQGTVTNGSGTNRDDENTGKSFAGRLEVDAVDGVTVGGGFSTHDYEVDENTENGVAWNADVNIGSYRDGLHVQAGVISGDNWLVSENATFFAWHATGSWYLPIETDAPVAAWEPLFRISQGDPDTDIDSDGGLLLTPGAMLYISGKNKIGFNVDIYSPETGSTEYSLKFQTFLHF